MNQAAIGSYIAKKRREKNLTQEQLAETLGVSNKTISKWENGKCMPDYSTIEQLCKELSVTLSELMDGEDAAEDSVRVYDDEQILDLLRRMQELEREKLLQADDDLARPVAPYAGVGTAEKHIVRNHSYCSRYSLQRYVKYGGWISCAGVHIRSLDWLVRCGSFSRNRCRRKACTETLTPKRHIACL